MGAGRGSPWYKEQVQTYKDLGEGGDDGLVQFCSIARGGRVPDA